MHRERGRARPHEHHIHRGKLGHPDLLPGRGQGCRQLQGLLRRDLEQPVAKERVGQLVERYPCVDRLRIRRNRTFQLPVGGQYFRTTRESVFGHQELRPEPDLDQWTQLQSSLRPVRRLPGRRRSQHRPLGGVRGGDVFGAEGACDRLRRDAGHGLGSVRVGVHGEGRRQRGPRGVLGRRLRRRRDARPCGGARRRPDERHGRLREARLEPAPKRRGQRRGRELHEPGGDQQRPCVSDGPARRRLLDRVPDGGGTIDQLWIRYQLRRAVRWQLHPQRGRFRHYPSHEFQDRSFICSDCRRR